MLGIVLSPEYLCLGARTLSQGPGAAASRLTSARSVITTTASVPIAPRKTAPGPPSAKDNYVEEERSVLSHLQNGFTQTFKRLSSGHLNPVDLSTAFLSGSSPDEILRLAPSWTPQICNIMACWALLRGGCFQQMGAPFLEPW